MELVLVVFLIALNGIFAMSEMSLVSSKKARLQQMVDKGSIGAAKAMALQDNPTKFLSAIQVGITTISILSGIVGEKSLVEPVSHWFVAMGMAEATAKTLSSVTVIAFLTYLSVVFGEIIPKRVALVIAERVASIIAIPMDWVSRITYPVVWIFTKTSQLIMKLLRLDKIKQMPVSNEEIKELMSQGSEAGIFHESEEQIITNVLHMDEKRVSTIMTHRSDLLFIDIKDDFKENISKIVNGKFSRTILVDDNIDNIVGILHVTDILPLIKSDVPFDLKNHVETTLYLPETVTSIQVLENFKRKKKEVAIIVNEHGENIGMVTLFDVMSAIVGDIATDEQLPKEILQRDENSWLVEGITNLDKVEKELDLDALNNSEDIYTIAGYILEKAACIPDAGFKFVVMQGENDITFEVMDMDKNTVDKVLITKTIRA
jgi:putative hemolysin